MAVSCIGTYDIVDPKRIRQASTNDINMVIVEEFKAA